MKNLLLTIFSFVLASGTVAAQDAMRAGKVEMEITKVKGGGMKGMMMKGSEQVLYFNDEYERMYMSMAKGMVKMDVLKTKADNSALMLTGGMMLGKKMVRMTGDNREGENEQPEYTLTYDEKDTKTIHGYLCQKAVFKADGVEMHVYYTHEIDYENNPIKEQFPDLEGFPLEYTITIIEEKMSMTYSTTSVSAVNPSDFELSTEGYEELTQEEAKELFKGIGQ